MPSMRAPRTRSASACAATDLSRAGQVRLAQLAPLRVLGDERGAVARHLAGGVRRLPWAAGSARGGLAGGVTGLLRRRAGGLAPPALPPRRGQGRGQRGRAERAVAAVSSSASAWRATARSASSRPTLACCSWPAACSAAGSAAAPDAVARRWPAEGSISGVAASRSACGAARRGGGAGGRRVARPRAARPALASRSAFRAATRAAAASRSAAAVAARAAAQVACQARGAARQRPGLARSRRVSTGGVGDGAARGLGDLRHQAGHALLGRRHLLVGGAAAVGQPVFDLAEAVGAEQLLQQGFLVLRVGAQEPGELALRQQHDLEELLGGHADEVRRSPCRPRRSWST